jgi:hypothetical protein
MPTAKRSIAADDTHELHQAHNGGSNQWEETERNPVVIAQDAPPLDAPDAVLHMDPYRRQSAILRALLFGQLPPFGLLVRHGHPGNSLVRQVALLRGIGIVRLDRALFVEPLIGHRSPMPRIKVEDFALRIGDDLTFERVALLLARIDALLQGLAAGTSHRRFEAVDQCPLYCIRCPTGLSLLPLLFCIPALGRTDRAQHEDHLMKGILRGVGADPKQLAYHCVGHVMPQINQGQQHFLIGFEAAPPPAAHRALAVRALDVLGLPPMLQFRQHLREQFAQGAERQSKECRDFLGWIAIEVREIHQAILPLRQRWLLFPGSSYGYGRQYLWVDRELYRAYYKEVYDRSGEYWKTFLLSGGIALTRDNVFSTPQSDYALAIDEHRAQTNVVLPLREGYDIRVNVGLDPDRFDFQNLSKTAK